MADNAISKIDIVIRTESKFRTGEVKEDALRWNYVKKIIEWWDGTEWKAVYVESQGEGVTGSITFKDVNGNTYQFTGSQVIDLSTGVYYAAHCKQAETADEATHAETSNSATLATNAENAEKALRDDSGRIIHETYATIAWVNKIINGTSDQLPASGLAWTVDADYESGTNITLPSELKYVLNAHNIRLALDGAVLSQGISYNEVDMGIATSTKINLMCKLEKGMVLDIWIIPVGINPGMMALADAVQSKLNSYRDEAEQLEVEVVTQANDAKSTIRNEVNSAKDTLQGYVNEGTAIVEENRNIADEVAGYRTEYLEYLKTTETFMDSAEASAYAARTSASESADNVVESRSLLEQATEQATIATSKADVATTQANIATNQAGIATTQANTATTQAGIATTQATNASNSASASATSAMDSANSATASANSATAASNSATKSANSATASANSATAAANSAQEAADTLASAVSTIKTQETTSINAVKSQQTISVNAVKTEGDTQVSRLQALGDMMQLSAETKNALTVTTITTAVASGNNWTLPNSLQYRYGVGTLMLFYNGAYMAKGSQYEEVGTQGEASSIIKLLQDFEVDAEIGIVILATSVYVNVDTSVGLTRTADGLLGIDIAKLKTALGIDTEAQNYTSLYENELNS